MITFGCGFPVCLRWPDTDMQLTINVMQATNLNKSDFLMMVFAGTTNGLSGFKNHFQPL
jgi:hypothetical protein